MKVYLTTITLAFLVVFFVVKAQVASPSQLDEGLARKVGCFKCHVGSDAQKAIAPTFDAIASKYKNNLRSADTLFTVIKNGSKGNWTKISKGIPMPPYSGRLTDAQIKSLVAWVLQR